MAEPLPTTILIVEDEERNRRLLDVFVSADGFEAVLASDGATALRMAASRAPALVLLDLMMPDMDGFEVMRRLKENPATRDIPVIIVSALDDMASRQRLMACGAEEFICKPVDRWELSMRMRRLLDARRRAAPVTPIPGSAAAA
ncbi:response regulator [Ramlibacter sp. 2FC]|uniref:response regulator n=1 Tax=Ramlibacter sp. 2FC TaxID=2502188 RepID=UPI0010F7C899|nr:response regulator [Ramlibacter sp. 2FC]